MGRYSYLTADPTRVWTSHPADSGDVLAGGRGATSAAHRAEAIPGIPPFQGGVAGFLGYEFGRRLERLPAPRSDDLGLPDAWLGAYDWVIAWDHAEGRAWVVDAAGKRGRGRSAEDEVRDIVRRLRGPAPSARPRRHPPRAPTRFRSGFTRDEYLRAVRAGPRVHSRGRHLPGQSLPALRGAVARRPLRLLPPAHRRQSGAVRRLLPRRRIRPGERLPRAIPDGGPNRPGGDAPDQGDATAWGHRGGGPPARGGTAREREGPRRKRDDRGPAAERPVEGVPAGHGRGARALRPHEPPDGASPRVRS